MMGHVRYSDFVGTDLDLLLRRREIDTVIISGCATVPGGPINALDALLRDYKVIYPSDGTCTLNLMDKGWGAVSKEEVNKVLFTILATFYATVLPTEEIIKRINSA